MTLAQYITQHLTTPFEWGKHDCVLFVAGWISIKSGKDMLEGVPKWTSAKGALKLVKELGGIEKLVEDRLYKIPVNSATDGDVTLYNDSLHIFSGPYIVGAGLSGIEFTDRGVATCAWRY